MEPKNIGILVGSLRKGSFSKKIAENIISLAPESLRMEIVEIGALEMFNQDFDDEGRTPASWIAFREQIKKYDAFLFITPEYNRSFPAVIKNALDIGSRPYGYSLWNKKPGAVIGVSPGALGAFGATHHLRQTLSFLNVPAMPQPEAYIGNVMALLGEDGAVNAETKKFLKTFINAFEVWVNTEFPS